MVNLVDLFTNVADTIREKSEKINKELLVKETSSSYIAGEYTDHSYGYIDSNSLDPNSVNIFTIEV
jgi:hypothetical protein